MILLGDKFLTRCQGSEKKPIIVKCPHPLKKLSPQAQTRWKKSWEDSFILTDLTQELLLSVHLTTALCQVKSLSSSSWSSAIRKQKAARNPESCSLALCRNTLVHTWFRENLFSQVVFQGEALVLMNVKQLLWRVKAQFCLRLMTTEMNCWVLRSTVSELSAFLCDRYVSLSPSAHLSPCWHSFLLHPSPFSLKLR